MNRFDLSSKFALITGSCGLLGQKHALALLEIGASVVLTDIDESLLIKTKKIFRI
jgi:NAD(P)-dependent dehydrogenase (short-subunit alcohol dehydrogenase family)